MAQDSYDERHQKGIFSLGLDYNFIFSSLEKFDRMGNEQLLRKRPYSHMATYNKNGKSDLWINSYYLGTSLMYRFLSRNDNFFGIEGSIGFGNTAEVYKNLKDYQWYPAESQINNWLRRHKYYQASLSVQASWGRDSYRKWYAKFKTSYMYMTSISDFKQNFTDEWINKDNTGGVWVGTYINRENVTFAPELGGLFTYGYNDANLFQFGIAYQFGLRDLYSLHYYSVKDNIRSKPNSITTRGNYVSFNLSVNLPLAVSYKKAKPVKIQQQKPATEPQQYSRNNLVFLIDVSVSMNAENKLWLLKQYMINMLDSLPAEDYITIVTFSGSAAVVLQPTKVSDRDIIEEKLASLSVRGNTDINRGLEKAYELLNKNHIQGGNNRIIMATDGEFRASPKTKQLIKENFESKKRIVLSVFHFAGNSNPVSLAMYELTVLGGGNYSIIDKNNINTKLENEYRQKIK